MKAWTDMAPRERDAAIAERVMGWQYNPTNDVWEGSEIIAGSEGKPIESNFWHPTTSRWGASAVEDEIERRGGQSQADYVFALAELLFDEGHGEWGTAHVMKMMRATSEQRCEAAWRACGGTE